MKHYDYAIAAVLLIAGCTFFGIFSVYVFGPDNKVEEIAEEIISHEIPIDINLTPPHLMKDLSALC